MSGQIWLLDLPDACASGGLDVTTFDGWETRSRSSGGYDDLLGVGYHHDASSPSSSDGSSDAYGWLYADDKPIGCMRLHRDGQLVVGAAGATNTMGKGGPLTCSRGTVPRDHGNQTLIAIEAANNGVGEIWPAVQVDAYIALVAALCDWYGFDPNRDIFSHWEYCAPSCPGRKIDPAGPCQGFPELAGTTGAATWSTPAFRQLVTDRTTHPPEPPPVEEDTDMLYIGRLGDANGAVWVGDGVHRIEVTDQQAATLEAQIGFGRWHHPHRSGYPPCTRVADIAAFPAHQLDLLVGEP